MASPRRRRGQTNHAKTKAKRARVGVDLDAGGFATALRAEVDQMTLRSERDLRRVAIRVQNEARKLAPVDTGRLRSSITHSMGRDSRGPFARVGTNVAYAPHVEFGTERAEAQPFMRPAMLLAARWFVDEMRRSG